MRATITSSWLAKFFFKSKPLFLPSRLGVLLCSVCHTSAFHHIISSRDPIIVSVTSRKKMSSGQPGGPRKHLCSEYFLVWTICIVMIGNLTIVRTALIHCSNKTERTFSPKPPDKTFWMQTWATAKKTAQQQLSKSSATAKQQLSNS